MVRAPLTGAAMDRVITVAAMRVTTVAAMRVMTVAAMRVITVVAMRVITVAAMRVTTVTATGTIVVGVDYRTINDAVAVGKYGCSSRALLL